MSIQDKKLYLLFSHRLTEEQEKDAYKQFGIGSIVYLRKELLDIWTSIPAEAAVLEPVLEPIVKYFEVLLEGDYVLVQGDFGATYILVNWIRSRGAIPVYATTKREVIEKQEGNKSIKTSVFQHVRYRIYGE